MTQPGSAEPSAAEVRAALAEQADPVRAAGSARFFKTGPGEYGEGDVFIGVTVPATRAVAKRFAELSAEGVDALLASSIHEERLCGLVLMVERFRRASSPRTRDAQARAALHRDYLRHLAAGHIDNWDLVDASAEYLVGGMVYEAAPVAEPLPALIAGLAASESIWDRRVAMLATFAATKAGDARPALAVAERLVDDPEDLLRKAVGWMLREVGKRVDRSALTGFLDAHAGRMPRVMLSYATEHLDPDARAAYRAVPRR